MGDSRAVAERGLVGNRWVLVGGIVYLLEWVAIIAVGVAGVGAFVDRGASPRTLLETYADHEDAMFAMAGWFAVVLLGRILLFVGLRQALADSGHRHLLMDLAVATSAVSVTIEIASYGLAAGATQPARRDDAALTAALDSAAAGVNLMIGGGLGVAIVCSAYCMWRSGLFSPVLNVLGAVAGVALIGAQLTVAPSLEALFDILYTAPLLFWVWMIWAGVVCWRRTPRAGRSGPVDDPAAARG